MKKLLLTTIVFLSFGAWFNLNAQCTVSNPTISNVTRVSNGNGTCNVKFDLSFTMQNNNGNKTIVIHLWPGSTYPNPAICYIGGTGCGQPTAAQLAGSYGSIVINNDPVSPTFYSTYPFISGVNILPTNPVIVRTGGGSNSTPFNFTLKEITLTNVACSGGVIVKGDIWSTNSGSLNSNTNPQCSTSGISLNIGDPTLNGFKNCSVPRLINFGVSTTNPDPITVTYKIYKSDGNNSFDPSTDIDVTLPGSDPITVSSANSPQGRSVGFIGDNTSGEHSDYWVVITYTPSGGTPFNVALLLANGACASLPVEFKSFTASREQSIVKLVWETASEINNKEFEIQRMSNGSQWETIAAVKSQAFDGNSSSILRYSYNDNNNLKAISQYRIRQSDIDGKMKYSVVRSVTGLGSSGKLIIYPNPSSDGAVTLSFKNSAGTHTVIITDAAGRLIRKWKDIVNDNIRIENLASGFYTISVSVTETGEQMIQKLIVK
ncbi:MAG: T9SS type A sorting domain-containing protein [Chitinophagaceae bacterium]